MLYAPGKILKACKISQKVPKVSKNLTKVQVFMFDSKSKVFKYLSSSKWLILKVLKFFKVFQVQEVPEVEPSPLGRYSWATEENVSS